MGVGGQRQAPAALPPGKGTPYPLYWRLNELQGRCGGEWEIWPPPGFDHQIVQPVASR